MMTRAFHNQQQGFSCAEEPFDAGYLSALLGRRAARQAELVLKYFRRVFEESSDGLIEILERLGAGAYEVSWSSALGPLRQVLLTKPLDPHRALVAVAGMALDLAEKGAALRFEVRLDRAEAFRFGAYLFPHSPSLTFESDGRGAQHPTPSGELVRTGTPTRPVLLAPAPPHGSAFSGGLAPCAVAPALLRPRYQAAYDVLVQCAHPYREWVERVIEILVPVETSEGSTTSSSFEDLPAVVALSHATSAISMADALVHEASHQHFFALTQLGPVHDGSDPKLYFSPAPRRDRPIDKILLAYHAFANTFLFYRYARTHGFDDADFCNFQENAYRTCLVDLHGPLATTRALTPLGRALFEPLAERVAAS
jgi:HEXXH motif-containing protein